MNNFIKTKGTTFVDSNGHEYIIKGMGFWGGNAPTAPYSFREADFANMASIGFNSVRLYLGANFIENDENFWNWLDERIEWARKYNMTLVLNLHFTPGAKSISDTALFVDTGLQDRLVALWQSIAKRYANEPIIAAYDIVNEPTANVADISKSLGLGSISAPYHEIFAIWENLSNRIVAAIREVDMNHVIIVERLWLTGCADSTSPNDQQDKWQNLNGKFNFPDINDSADNYAYTYHCMSPGVMYIKARVLPTVKAVTAYIRQTQSPNMTAAGR